MIYMDVWEGSCQELTESLLRTRQRPSGERPRAAFSSRLKNRTFLNSFFRLNNHKHTHLKDFTKLRECFPEGPDSFHYMCSFVEVITSQSLMKCLQHCWCRQTWFHSYFWQKPNKQLIFFHWDVGSGQYPATSNAFISRAADQDVMAERLRHWGHNKPPVELWTLQASSLWASSSSSAYWPVFALREAFASSLCTWAWEED